MTSLARLPVATRRRMGAVFGGFALLLLMIGSVSVSVGGLVPDVCAAVAFAAGVPLGLMAWGTLHSTRVRPAPRVQVCGCGHEHDPAEFGIIAEPTGCATADCANDCADCPALSAGNFGSGGRSS